MANLIVGVDYQQHNDRYTVSVVEDDQEGRLLYHKGGERGRVALLSAGEMGKLLEATGNQVRYWLRRKGEQGAYYKDRFFGFQEQTEAA